MSIFEDVIKESSIQMEKKYDYLVVGAGLFGATFAYMAQQKGKKSLVIDKRNHSGGNLYCENVEGINVHKYGAHIFHTSNKKVWEFVNSLVEFNRYTNSPLANYKGDLYNLPFNMNTFHQMWGGVKTPDEAISIIDEQRREAIQKLAGRQPKNLEDQALVLVGRDIYEKLIKGYTEKQWGRPCSELPAFIIRRLPVRLVYDNNYFNDLYQGVPIGGYNKLIERLLDGSDVVLSTDFFLDREKWTEKAKTVVFTGMIDEYFGFRFGRLQYRTVIFEEEIIDCPNFQGNAVINYTDSATPFTRVIEHKHFEAFGATVYEIPKTVVSREYSVEWKEGMTPYYPLNDDRNEILAKRYRELASREKNVIFGGRLAEYKYYDMAPIIEKVLSMTV